MPNMNLPVADFIWKQQSRREFLVESVAFAGTLFGVFNLATGAEPEVRGLPPMTFPVLRADHPNSNKRIYPRAILENIVKIFHKNSFGVLGMPVDSITRLKDISHEVKKVFMQGDYLLAEIGYLSTPCGRILQSIPLSNIAFRTAGVGGGSVNEDGYNVIKDSYRLISINAIPVVEAAKL